MQTQLVIREKRSVISFWLIYNEIHWFIYIGLITVFCFIFFSLLSLPTNSLLFSVPHTSHNSRCVSLIHFGATEIKTNQTYKQKNIFTPSSWTPSPSPYKNKQIPNVFLPNQHVCAVNRRVGAREGEVQVNHRRFGPDFLRTLGVLEISTTLLLPLPLLFTLGWISLGNIIAFLPLFALISLFLWTGLTWIENIVFFRPSFFRIGLFLLEERNHLS